MNDPSSACTCCSSMFQQELIIRRREYRTVNLSPESNVTIQLRFDALTCCMFGANSSHVTFWTHFLLGTTAGFDTLFSLLLLQGWESRRNFTLKSLNNLVSTPTHPTQISLLFSPSQGHQASLVVLTKCQAIQNLT